MSRLLVLALSLLVAGSAAAAAPRPGSDVAVAGFRIDVDLDASTISVKPFGARLDGVTLGAVLASDDAMTQVATLSVSLHNGSDRSLLHDLAGDLLGSADDLDPVGEWTIPSKLLLAGTSSNTADWLVFHGARRAWSMKVRIRADVPLVAREGGQIRGPGGVRVVVPEGALPYEAFVSVESVDSADPVADQGDLQWLGGIHYELQPTSAHSAMPPPDLPLELRLPSKESADRTEELLVALVMDADRVASDELQQGTASIAQWIPTANAIAKGGKLRSTTGELPGVFASGTYGFFRATPRLYVRGVVRDAGGPRRGSIVKAAHSPSIAVTSPTGAYVLAVPSIGAVALTALDPLLGQRGVAAGGVIGGARTLELNVTVAPMSGEVVTRDGLRNAGFEEGDLSGWVHTTAAVALTTPLVCSAASVTTGEGATMASISTVAPDVPASTLAQPFDVPSGVRTLFFDYNVLSSEFTTGTPAPDAFVATVVTPGGDIEVVRVTVDDASGTALLGDCGDGENWAETGWRTASVDLSAFSAGPASRVRLVLSVTSAVDASLPTRALVDNVRFATLWVDPKLVGVAAGDASRASAMARNATQVLRQAGVNVRTRPLATLVDPGAALSVLDITLAGSGACGADLTRQDIELTAEMAQLLAYGRSPVPTDMNAWWVQSFSGQGGIGYAVGPDDFCSGVSGPEGSGIFLTDLADGWTLAHEAGHLLLSPASAGAGLEHSSAPGNFMLSNAPPLGLLTRNQSAILNRVGAPLLVP